VIAFILRNWRWIAIAVIFLFLVGAVLSYGHRQYERGVADAQREAQQELERSRQLWEQIQRETDEAKDQRIAELEKRATRVIRRDPPIRMCEPEDAVRVPAGADTGSTGGPVLPTGRDLQPELVQYGRDCEAIRQELIAVRDKLEALRK